MGELYKMSNQTHVFYDDDEERSRHEQEDVYNYPKKKKRRSGYPDLWAPISDMP